MSVRVRKGVFMTDTLDIRILVLMTYFNFVNYIYRLSSRQRTGGHGMPREASWRQREATEASSRAQILARQRISGPLPKQPETPKRR